jgi:hypothetical protein
MTGVLVGMRDLERANKQLTCNNQVPPASQFQEITGTAFKIRRNETVFPIS